MDKALDVKLAAPAKEPREGRADDEKHGESCGEHRGVHDARVPERNVTHQRH